MTDDTTTIEITEDQRDELKALKAHERESYKSVIGRLLEGDDADGTPDLEAAGLVALEDRLNEVAEMLESVQDNWECLNGEEIHGGVHESEHQLRDVLDRLDRIESAASTAEKRTGSIENTLEGLQ